MLMQKNQARELRSNLHSRTRMNVLGYLFVAPALLLYLVFNVWPMLRGVLMAFTNYRFLDPSSSWSFNGIENFQKLFRDRIFWSGLTLSVQYSVMVFTIVVVLSLCVALLIAQVSRGAGFYRWAAYLPTILPVAVTFLMFGEIFNYKYGLVNATLQSLGVTNVPNWLGNARFVLPSLAVADIWRSLGLPILLFLIGLYNINSELYEAAAMDGATKWQQFWGITLPLLKPSFLLVIVLNLGILAVTEPMLLLTNGGPQNASRTLGFYTYQIAFRLGELRLGYAAAISLVLGLISALLALLAYRLLREKGEA